MAKKIVKKHEDGYLVKDKFYFGPEKLDSEIMQLLMEKGDIMRYGTEDNNLIDFPGEYDLGGDNIRCWEADEKLSYVIRTDGKAIALIASVGVLDVGTFEEVDRFYCMSEKIADEVEKMDFEGEILLFEDQ